MAEFQQRRRGETAEEHEHSFWSYLISRPTSALLTGARRAPKISVHFSRARSHSSVASAPVHPLVPLSQIKEALGEDGTAHLEDEDEANVVAAVLAQQTRRRHYLLSRRKKAQHQGNALGTRSSTPDASSSSLSDFVGEMLPDAAAGPDVDDDDDALEYDISDGDMSVSGRSEASQFSHIAAWGDATGPNFDDIRRSKLAALAGPPRKVTAFATKQAAFAAKKTFGTKEDLQKRREAAKMVIKRHARRASERRHKLQKKAAAAGHKIVHPKAPRKVIQSREAAQAVIANNLMKWRERRLQRKAKHDAKASDKAEHGAARSRSFSRRGRKVATRSPGRQSRSPIADRDASKGVSRSPTLRAAPPDMPHADSEILTPAEAALARQLAADWRKPPSERPQATLVCDKPELRCWRWKAPPDAAGNVFDIYESEFEVPVPATSFQAMQCELEARTKWDATTKAALLLEHSGPAHLKYIHGSDGDIQDIYWLIEAPWPLKDREYLMRRRCACIAPDGRGRDERSAATADGGASELIVRIDGVHGAQRAAELRPTTPAKTLRVTTHENTQVAWTVVSPSGVITTRVRGRFMEDPMMPIPKWFLSTLTDKMFPRSVKLLIKTAVERERRLTAAVASPPPS